MSATAARGRLLLVPNALDLGAATAPELRDVLPLGVIRRAAALTHWVAENAKSARAFLKRVAVVEPLALALQDIRIAELPRLTKGRAGGLPASAFDALLAPALEGHDLGLLSEAGLPAVADPGAALVAAAHAAGIVVEPLPGLPMARPSSSATWSEPITTASAWRPATSRALASASRCARGAGASPG